MSRRVLLMDNGSLEPGSTLQLRRLAAALEAKIGVRVEPVSLAHSAKVPASELDGRPAELFEAALDRLIGEGARDIVVAPLFVGPSHAVVRHVPAVVAERKKATPGLKVEIAAPLFVAGEQRLAEILADHAREEIKALATGARVAVVDHGSPSRAVTAVRDAVAEQVRLLLGSAVIEVAACSMERREGDEFAFNEPLLGNLLAREGWRDGAVVVALLFIGPGKHAGADGDVAQIVRRARAGKTDTVRFTPVMGLHPRLIEILADRVGAVS
jgi:sirohydrochlorin ferrochelatase